MRVRWLFPAGALLALACTNGCIGTVGQAHRGKLADPMMSFSEDATETYAKQKLHTSREGAAGGDGAAAGGGCACQ
jgi:Domain of unknown function (DUF4266)